MPPNGTSHAQEFVGLIHAFGVLRTDSTPCGQPMSVSTAHAVCELATTGPLQQSELADRLGLTTSSVSRLVDQLERKEWAAREADPDEVDKRVRLVRLTERGHDIATTVLAARFARFERLLDKIDPAKHVQVFESLHLLREAADELR
ncbi:MAG: MarR family transcriptional regulator [Acidimicrobiales bacterium]